MIKLEKVTKENYWEVVNLSVSPSQEDYVVSNAISIGQSKVQDECIPVAIYKENLLIGFAMYCIDTDDDQYWIYRIMIDQKYQSKGFGKEAFGILLQKIKADKTKNVIYLGVHRKSEVAVCLYESYGFAFEGQVFGDEHIMCLRY